MSRMRKMIKRGMFGGGKAAAAFVSAEVGTVDASTLAVNFNRQVAATNAKTGMTVTVNGSGATISTGTIQTDKHNIYLAMVAPIIYGDVVTVAYNGAAGNITDYLTSAALSSVTAKSVTNNVALVYLFKDEFTTARAVGAINGTAAEPGPGTRSATDTGSIMTIHDDVIDLGAGDGSYTTPRVSPTGSFVRTLGKTIFARIKMGATNKGAVVGFVKTLPLYSSNSISIRPHTNGKFAMMNRDGESINTADTGEVYVAGQYYDVAIQIRASGYYWYIRSENTWKLVKISELGTTTPLTPILSSVDNPIICDFIRMATLRTPVPLLSDGFSSAGVTDGLGHVEANGGGGLSWINWGGTWSTIGGVAQATALNGNGEAMQVVDLGTPNVAVSFNCTWVGGMVGVLLRGRDTNNMMVCAYDGSRMQVQAHLRGLALAQILQSATGFTGPNFKASIYHKNNGTSLLVTDYSNTDAKTVVYSMSGGELSPGTFAGIFTTDIRNTIDSVVFYPAGRESQYVLMDQYTSNTSAWLSSEKFIVFDGNSMLAGSDTVATGVVPVSLTSLGEPYHGVNVAVGGRTGATMLTDQHYANSYYNAARAKNILVYWEGINDIANGLTGAQAWANTVSYCQAARTAGFRIVLLTMSKTSTDGQPKLDYNALMVAQWATYADAIARPDLDANIGDASSGTNLTYFQAAGSPHLTPTGYAIVAGLVVTAIQGLG